ncbi:hypothetical protein GQR93_02960 [Lentilactobacillus hilgardii]|uniref:Uncharacterized protein n=1 Tax=Lentilactobacillus hilgardii TaxID=1588 RepID=A0A6P1E288_LENHI|nr:hypothetical protein [Lentilactobacillus hilgardii]QHB51257.1 hypothetical protein GQR93_02960 [Lentilactobacillus hilgardii]
MRLKMGSIVKKMGVPIQIYSADGDKGASSGGFKTHQLITDRTPDLEAKWALVPVGTFAVMTYQRNTGTDLDLDMELVGTKFFPKDSVVVDVRTGMKYLIKSITDFQGYSDIVIYELKVSDKDEPNI